MYNIAQPELCYKKHSSAAGATSLLQELTRAFYKTQLRSPVYMGTSGEKVRISDEE